ncbi:MAG: S-layer homology domain-containing protein, partial [Oscillospiraceae bacterium]|nr:S-layer homology domain-containing protein [Oscillospiraceae bacterium]
MSKKILAAMMAFMMTFSCMPTPAHAAGVTPTASGTTYYVSSIHGAEGNSGTSESAPFKSLLKINEITLQPGDRVLLERGSVFVDEYLHVKGSGSAEAPIIIDVYGDESLPKPLIQTNGNGVWYQDYGKRLDNVNHKYRGNVSTCILLYDVEYIEISNIAMTNEGNYAPGEVYNSKSRIDRTGVAGIAENIGTVDHVYLRDLDIRNVQGNVRNKHMANGGIYFLCHQPDNEAATGVSRFDDVLIEGCRLDEVNRWGIAVGYTAYWDQFVYGPTIDPEVCKTYGSTNVVIRNNYLTNVGGDGITTMYCYQPLMEYNVLDGYCQDMTDAIYGPSDGGLVAAGIWPWMCKTAILQYNEAYNSTPNPDGQAWDADWGDNAIYQYNYSCNNAGGAIMFCGQYACNTVFRYNISQNDLAGVLNLASSPNGEIYNNVFYIKEGVKINRTGMSSGRGNVISNNIFYYAGSTPADATLGNWGDITAEWQNNIYYNYETIPADESAITDDPMFVDPGKGPVGAQASGLVHDRSAFEGYQISPDSPAINAGIPIKDNGGLDFFGNELDLFPDIGVHEHGTFQGDADRAVVVDVKLGQTKTITDLTGNFSDAEPVIEDEKIASVSISGTSSTTRTRGNAISTLTDGKYIVVNNRANKTLTNLDAAAQQGEAGTMAGLSLEGTKDSISDNAVWTVTASGTGYTLQDAKGKYLSIVRNDANVVSDESVVTVVYRNGTWTLSQDGAYLNDAANKSVCASGWDGDGVYDASTDAGSLWTIYPVTEETVSSTELVFTGLYPGTTNITIGDTLYIVRVRGGLEMIELEVGETAEFADPSGNYTHDDTSALDPDVATVELSGILNEVFSSASKVTSIQSGSKYMLVNTRAGKPVTNAPASVNTARGLSLSGSKENTTAAAIWTVTAANDGYTIQDQNGKYMTVGSDSAGLTDDAAILTLSYRSGTWTISQNNAYLNDFGGNRTCAAGWVDWSAASDSGSQWEIYEVTSTTEENGTKIVFTAVGSGETYVRIGGTMYHITVTGSAHGFENGFCDHCDEYEPAELVNGVYEIGNAGQLYWFAKLVDGGELDANAILTADITVNAAGEERRWNAIGSNSKKYSGTFDGQGHSICGLFYENDATTGGYIGLIATLDEGGVVKNVTVADSYLCGYRFIGAIVGSNNGGTIENCHNDGTTVLGSGSNIGGIAGGSSGTVIGCSSSGEISSDAGNNLGGIVGSSSGTVELCFNTGSVTSDCCSDEHCVGGIVGENLGGTIRNCYNVGGLSNKGAATGGIAGKADRGTIENCHNVGSVSGKKDVGGIVGKTYNAPAVNNCYFLSDESEARFASGEIAYLLNGSGSDESVVWKQTLGTDAYPTFEGGIVYYNAETGTYSNSLACTHVPAEAVKENVVEATCTEDGSYDSVVYCTVCGEELSRDTVTVPALGHTEEIIPAVEATCTEPGLTEGVKCSVCGEILVAQEEIPALGHDFVNGECTRCDAVMDATFEDVAVGSFFFDPVEWAVEKGITTGATENTFNPNGDLLRAQFVTFLWRAAGEPEPANPVNPFTDVKTTDFFYKAV